MIPVLASIFLDYKCNFRCSHCSVGSNPHISMPMPRSLLQDLMRQIREIPSVKVVVFTGGETTLRKDLLFEGLSMAKEGGCATRIVTNGWWARTPQKAREFVKELRAAGLDELNASYDDYHVPFISVDYIVNLVRAGLEEDMTIALAVVKDNDAKYNSNSVRQALVDGLGMSVDEIERRIVIVDDNPTPTGTGQDMDISGLQPQLAIDSGCEDVIKTFSVHPNGNIKVCCGHAMFYNGDLNVGNLYEDSLANILNRGQRNTLYWMVHTVGPKRILDRLGVKGNYSSLCHACHVLFSEHRQELIDYIGEHKEEILVRDIILNDRIKVMARTILDNREGILERLGKA